MATYSFSAKKLSEQITLHLDHHDEVFHVCACRLYEYARGVESR